MDFDKVKMFSER